MLDYHKIQTIYVMPFKNSDVLYKTRIEVGDCVFILLKNLRQSKLI